MKSYIDSQPADIGLQKAILLYGNNSEIHYASVHPVEIMDSTPRIRAGQPVSKEGLALLYEELMGGASLKFIDDRRVLAYDGRTLLFWLQPKKRKVFFDCDEPMGKVGGVTPHTGLVFSVNDHSTPAVFSVKGRARPTPESVLYHAPYMNVWDDGDICMGSVQAPKTSTTCIDAWEAAFFRSVFTHPNEHRAVNYPGGMYSLWADLLSGATEVFPEDSLLPHMVLGQEMTLSDLLTTH
ncbi:PRTRC system protein B [Acidithiobacillus ferridurans]|uniref:PRTRC system protein B n=1 Tax=Acidithiobacillus ferridurans TaxID=1232575 RepID=A0A8X8G9M7_ACIFI|nr:PRTRC system protein B [Acidithiobacillus ferridurans]MBU2715587.1 PRTRC system protein B [Acidithiobacillus ferridurans]MBU2722923.1 PRTRC system protein B [Acidithiobacillus ferridurans]MBU2728185.1 PRTRC system protein B [Acidithiobacillus ferridurans]